MGHRSEPLSSKYRTLNIGVFLPVRSCMKQAPNFQLFITLLQVVYLPLKIRHETVRWGVLPCHQIEMIQDCSSASDRGIGWSNELRGLRAPFDLQPKLVLLNVDVIQNLRHESTQRNYIPRSVGKWNRKWKIIRSCYTFIPRLNIRHSSWSLMTHTRAGISCIITRFERFHMWAILSDETLSVMLGGVTSARD